MKSLSKAKFKIDETVKVITPDIFIRCGYPLGIEDMRKELESKYREDLQKFMEIISVETQTENRMGKYLDYNNTILNKGYQRMASGIAHFMLHSRGYGGRNRSIHVETKPEYAELTARVTEIKYCMTGVHHSGSYTPDSPFGPEEYDPPYLEDAKRHRILTCWNNSFGEFRIEDKNVEKIDV